MSTKTPRTRTAKTTTGATTNSTPAHQTHGAVTPIAGGAITSVTQLLNKGRSVAKGSVGSFDTLEEYSGYLSGLATYELHRHAREEARIVPIDDRERLIKRLEASWTGARTRYPGLKGNTIPSRPPFTPEQIKAQEDIRNQLLKQ